jgi:hypothetical protein
MIPEQAKTFPDELARALKQLRGKISAVWLIPDEGPDIGSRELTQPLAALLERAAEADRDPYSLHKYCRICGSFDGAHAIDCALVTLVRAINGEW